MVPLVLTHSRITSTFATWSHDTCRCLLPGSISCKELLRYQCGQLAAALGKDGQGGEWHAVTLARAELVGRQDDADWTYAEGTLEHPWDLVKISDFEKAVAKSALAIISMA